MSGITKTSKVQQILTTIELQYPAYTEILQFFKQIRIQESNQSSFTKYELTKLLSFDTVNEQYRHSITELSQLHIDYPNISSSFFNTIKRVIHDFYTKDTNELKLLNSYLISPN